MRTDSNSFIYSRSYLEKFIIGRPQPYEFSPKLHLLYLVKLRIYRNLKKNIYLLFKLNFGILSKLLYLGGWDLVYYSPLSRINIINKRRVFRSMSRGPIARKKYSLLYIGFPKNYFNLFIEISLFKRYNPFFLLLVGSKGIAYKNVSKSNLLII